MSYFVYIIFSKTKNRFYTGHTNDLERRLSEHQSGLTFTTKTGAPWIIVYSQEVPTTSDAIRLERQIKKRGAGRFINDQR